VSAVTTTGANLASNPNCKRLSALRPIFMPPSEKDLKELCAKLVACNDEDEAIELAVKLRAALHAHIEEVRNKLRVFHSAA